MEARHFIDKAKEIIPKNYSDETLRYYLKESGVPESMLAYVIQTATAELSDERFERYSKLNKILYYLWLTLGILTFIFIIFILPNFQIVVGHKFIFSFLSSFFCCLFAYLSILYRKTWTEKYARNIGRPKIQYPLLIMMWLPGVTLHFIFSARFSYAQNAILKQTQIEVTGHVVGGNSVAVKRLIGGEQMANVSNIVVEFKTKDGQNLIVSKDVDVDVFKKFYKGEEIQLIYSKINPQNIDLLADESSIRNFKNTQERELRAPDLLHLLMVDQQDMLNELDKISSGWTYLEKQKSWINEKRECTIRIGHNEVDLTGKLDYNSTYPIYLTENGFTQTNKDDPDDLFHTEKKVFENKQFIFNVEGKVNPGGDGGYSIISVIRKQ